MKPVLTAMLSALRHRRLQALVIGGALALASAAATLALGVLFEAQAPFDRAFAAANGAHLVIAFNGSLSTDQLAATATADEVTATAGPWPLGVAGFLVNPGDVARGGRPEYLGQIVSARSDPATAVDRIAISQGRWWQADGELVISQSWADRYELGVGDSITLQQAPIAVTPGGGKATPRSLDVPPLATRTMNVVGVATSVSTPDIAAWMSSTDLTFFAPAPLETEQMLYRVDPSATDGDLARAQASITADLPAGAVDDSSTYLALRASFDRLAQIYVPILLAFSLFALSAAIFVIFNVVSGIVLARYRDIGVMKSIGFTPPQVTSVLLGEILVPTTVGALLGAVVGTLFALPILDQTARAFNVPPSTADAATVALIVFAGVVSIAALAAAGPAVRAGRLNVVEAIARGTSPATHGVAAIRRAAQHLALPTPIRLGVTAELARPLRSLMIGAALVVGVAAVVFSVGLNMSLRLVAADIIRDQASPVRLQLEDTRTQASAVTAVVAADRDTTRFVSIAEETVDVPQLGGIPYVAYQGDSGWLGYALISGRWFNGQNEAVAPTNFFTTSGLHVGDQVTVVANGRSATVTLVGEILDQARENRDDLLLRGDWSTLAFLDPSVTPDRWEIQPAAGVDPHSFGGSVSDSVNHAVSVDIPTNSATDEGFLLMEGVIGALGLVLVLVSIAGVFNTVLLEVRQRMRETAVLKAIGMSSRQVMAMVLAAIVPIALIAGLIGVPIGVAVQHGVLEFMGQAAVKSDVPPSVLDVLSLAALVLLGLSGVLIGILGAIVPARRAARAHVAPVLQTE